MTPEREVEGFRVQAYATAHELLNGKSLPGGGCLVTDYQMPGINGLELIRRLRDRHLMIPAILITALPDENLRSRAAAAEVSLIEKPVLGIRLLEEIRKTFEQHTKPSLRTGLGDK